jgi:hypothetical protein
MGAGLEIDKRIEHEGVRNHFIPAWGECRIEKLAPATAASHG